MPVSSKTNAPGISIIVLTCNSEKFIRPCLGSIFKQLHEGLEVIVVDNGSKDKSVAIIKENFRGIGIIENAVNLGAAEARNQGIKLARGEWILFLDCDTVLKDDFFAAVLKTVDKLPPETGMLQPKILNPDKRTIYSCGIHLAWSRRFYDIGSQKRDNQRFTRRREIFGPCSAAALYRRRLFEGLKEDTGYFDRRFFFLVEDVDLAWRAKKHYWKCLFIPEAVCYHQGNSSSLGIKRRQFLSFRNRYIMVKKNEGVLRYSAKLLPLLIYDLPRFCFLFFTNDLLRSRLFGRESLKKKP